jgi:hypothetical protein
MNIICPTGLTSIPLTPAEAGVQALLQHGRMCCDPWIPAFAGMSGCCAGLNGADT